MNQTGGSSVGIGLFYIGVKGSISDGFNRCIYTWHDLSSKVFNLPYFYSAETCPTAKFNHTDKLC